MQQTFLNQLRERLVQVKFFDIGNRQKLSMRKSPADYSASLHQFFCLPRYAIDAGKQ